MPDNYQGDHAGKPVPEENALLNKVQQYIFARYQPEDNPVKADVLMTTNEIYNAVNSFCPDPDLTPYLIANWLNEKGFTFFETGSFKFEWLFKRLE